MTKRKFISIVAFVLALLMVFAACGRRRTEDAGGVLGFRVPEGHPLEQLEYLMENFPQTRETGEAHVPGTTFMYGIASTPPIAGNFGGAIFSDQVIDNWITTQMGTAGDGASLLTLNNMYQLSNDGVCRFEYDLNAMTFTMHMQHDVYWHDGVPLTLADLVFTYEMIAHPDYHGLRRTAEIELIRGFSDSDGSPGSISGLVLSNNNRTLTKHLTDMPITLLYGGLWYAPMPKHIFEKIPMMEMATSSAVIGTNEGDIIGWGPWIHVNTVPGDAVQLRRNPNYVFGAPKIEHLRFERFDPAQAGELMAAGRFDLIMQFPTHLYNYHKDASNFTFLGAPSNHYSYLAFRLGDWDSANRKNVYNGDRLMARLGPDFRRAMAYAVDELFFTQTVHGGLRFPAASIAPPNHLSLVDVDFPGLPYNPDKARELLDNAGFNNFDSDGFRTWPDGSPITIQWALPDGPLAEEIHAFYSQAWRAVGIRVVLWQGRTHDQLYLWDVLDEDLYLDSSVYPDQVHIYTGAWQTGSNPNPEGIWGHIFWNASRYTSPEYDAFLYERMVSREAWDPDYLKQVFSDWQWYWYDYVPAFPHSWTITLHALNNRVTSWETRHYVAFTGNLHGWKDIGLSAPDPIR